MEEQLLESKMEGLEGRVIVEGKTLIDGKPVTDERKQLLKEMGEDLIDSFIFEGCQMWDSPFGMAAYERNWQKKIRVAYLNFNPPSYVIKGHVWVSPSSPNDKIEEIMLENKLLEKINNLVTENSNIRFRYKDVKVTVYYKYVGNPFAGIQFPI